MRRFELWKIALAGLLLAGLLAGCSNGANDAAGSSQDISLMSIEKTPAQQTETEPEEPPAQLPGELPQNELTEIALWLDQFGNCELLRSGFSTAEEADVSAMLYDGAGIGTSELTKEERAVLEELGAWLEYDVIKVRADKALVLIQSKPGLDWDLEQLKERLLADDLADWYYLEEYNAFYLIKSDTMMINVVCEEGVRLEDGTLEIKCRDHDTTDMHYIVTLYPLENGYRFCSNVIVYE